MNSKSKRAEYKEWLDHGYTGPRNPGDKEALLKVAGAFDAVQRDGKLTKNRLQTVVNGVSSKKALVWDGSSTLLMFLSEQFPEAATAILELSRSKQGHVRFNALCCLGKPTPPDVVDAAIRSGLTDKSSRVRWKAAQQAHVLNRVNLVPDITAALEAERHAKTRESLDLSLKLLRDGYTLEEQKDGRFFLTVSYRGGFCCRYVSANEMKSLGVEAIAAEMRDEQNAMRGLP